MEQYNVYKQKIKKVYTDSLCMNVERDCLDRLRIKKGYKCDSKEDERKKAASDKRKHRANKPVPDEYVKRRVVSTMSDDEDEEDEMVAAI